MKFLRNIFITLLCLVTFVVSGTFASIISNQTELSNFTDLSNYTEISNWTELGPYGASSDPYGPELVTNGTFDTDTSVWTPSGDSVTLSASGGELEIAGNGGFNDLARQTISTEIGETYYVELMARKGTSAELRLRVFEGSSPFSILLTLSATSATTDTYTGTFDATQTTTRLEMYQWSGSAGSVFCDSISLKKVL